MIKVLYFEIDAFEDQSVGIMGRTWKLTQEDGPFEFDDETHLRDFQDALGDAIEVLDGERPEVIPMTQGLLDARIAEEKWMEETRDNIKTQQL